MPEISRKSPFLQIFIGLFPYISLFFHTKTLFVAMPTIKHGLIVNKSDFWSRNFLKIAGTAYFRRKNGISWISRAVLYIFSWNFAHWCKMTIPKMWRSPIFEKYFFPAENARNMPENRFFLHFLEFSSLAFSDFLQKDAYLQCSKHGRVRFLRKNFFRLKMPEIAVFADFHWIFSLYSFLCFLHKNIIDNNAHHQAWFNCQ